MNYQSEGGDSTERLIAFLGARMVEGLFPGEALSPVVVVAATLAFKRQILLFFNNFAFLARKVRFFRGSPRAKRAPPETREARGGGTAVRPPAPT